MGGLRFIPITALLFASVVHADTFTFDLTSAEYFDAQSSTGFWNITTGQIQAPLAVAGVAGSELDLGSGKDGAFLNGPNQEGVTVSGSTIIFNTNTKSEFHFTTFTLGASFTITAVGTEPLVIKVLGTTDIQGVIDLDGADGADNGTAGAGNEVTGPIAGGAGKLGGGSGGRGGQIDGTSPTSGTPTTAGGSLGTHDSTSGAEGGGGGGCNGTGATNAAIGSGSAGTCTTQSTIADAFESTFLGGAGGGGGGGCHAGGTCDGVVGGGGGGAGGGALRIVSGGPISISGTVSSRGGAGGLNDATAGGFIDCGGGGGGGAGGSIWLQSASTLSGGGTLDLSGGAGGVSTSCPGFGYDGGNGSPGVLRTDDSDGGGGAGTPDQAKSTTIPTGQTYVVYSKAIDFSDGYYNLNSVTETIGCGAIPGDGTLNVTYEGSDDGTTFTDSVSAANIPQLSQYPYIRARVEISSVTTNPPCLTGLSIDYSLAEVTDLDLAGGGLLCAPPANASGTGRSSPISAFGDFGVLLLAVALSRCFIARRPNE